MWQHGRIAGLYDPSAFNAAMQDSGIAGIYDIYDANALLLVAVTAPLAWWPPLLARAIWLWFNLGLLLMVVACLFTLFVKRNLLYLGLITASVLLYAPLQENFRLGQVYIPFLLGACLTLVWYDKVGGAIGLALQLVIKLYYGIFGLVWGLARPKTLLLALTLVASATILLLPWFGLDLWWQYARLASSFNQRPYIGVTAYQTLNGFFSHLFHYEQTWNPHPIADVKGLSGFLSSSFSALIVTITVGVIFKLGRRKGPGWYISPVGFQGVAAVSLALAPVLAPAAEEYHFTLLLVPLFVSAKLWLGNKTHRLEDLAMWVVAVLLLGPAWPYKSWPDSGWLAVVAYPRLYGAMVLWLVLLKLVASHEKARGVLSEV